MLETYAWTWALEGTDVLNYNEFDQSAIEYKK